VVDSTEALDPWLGEDCSKEPRRHVPREQPVAGIKPVTTKLNPTYLWGAAQADRVVCIIVIGDSRVETCDDYTHEEVANIAPHQP
jgi:hypothetical protein